MTSPRLIFNDFFRSPFGGEMKSIGGGGEGGVLENIQQQVADNGEALQALQGGIGGLPNTPFQPATLQPVYGDHRGTGSPGTPDPVKIAYENPGQLPDLLDLNPPISIVDAGKDSQAQLRAEYEKAVADAKRQRDGGFKGRMVLPGEMSFEEFARMQLKPGSPFDMLGGPMQSDVFNIGQVEQNPGIGLMTMPTNLSYIGDGAFYDPRGIPNDEDRIQYGNVGNTRLAGPLDQYGVAQDPSIGKDLFNIRAPVGMDQLFGRAFAGKPI